MATIASLLVQIGADSSGLRKEIAASQRQLKRGFGPEALAASEAVVGVMAGLSAAIGAVGIASIKMAADMEQNRIAFTTMLGSATEADTFLRDLAKFAEQTPFEFPGLINSSKKLLAMGYTAQEVIPTLTAIGDAVAAVGGGADVLDRVTLAFGQIKAKGSISAEEMKQLAEAGIPAWQMLANVIGKTIPETMKLAEQKAIDAEGAVAGMIAQMGTKYGGMMEKQSQTITGTFSNIQDKAGSIMRDMGEEITEALDLQTKMKASLEFLDDLASRVKRSGVKEAMAEMIPESIVPAIYAIAGAITAALIPALTAMAYAAWAALVPLLPLVAIGAALGVVAYSAHATQKAMSEATSEADMFLESFTGKAKEAEKAANLIEGGLSRAMDGMNPDLGDYVERKAKEMEDAAAASTSKVKGLLAETGAAGEDAWKKIQDAAERTSESIEREWVQTTKTQIEQLDIWQSEQLTALEKTKEANENYERDKLRVAASYSAKRIEILKTEADEAKRIRERQDDIKQGVSLDGMTGSAKLYADIDAERQAKIKAIKDAEFSAVESANLIAEVNSQARQKEVQAYQSAADVKADIDAAYRANSFAALQVALTEEDAMRLNNYTAQQEMMGVYQAAQLAATSTTAQLMADMYGGALSGLTTAFSNIFMNIKNADQAMKEFGKSMLKIIADYYAKQLAGKILMSLMGKKEDDKILKESIKNAAATATAWAPAAAMVSLATMGKNAKPAMLGIAATTTLSLGLASVPALASGGITTGPTIAQIGEGRYQEAVLPLNKRMFEKMGLTGGGQSVAITQNNYGDINREVDYDQIQTDLGNAIGFALQGA